MSVASRIEAQAESKKEVRAILIKALSFAFVEIRAAGWLAHAQKLADVVHNVPSALSADACAPSRILIDVRKRAERNNIAKHVEALLQSARKAVCL